MFHKDIKSNECPECGKLYVLASSLKSHLLCHVDNANNPENIGVLNCPVNIERYPMQLDLENLVAAHTDNNSDKVKHSCNIENRKDSLKVSRKQNTQNSHQIPEFVMNWNKAHTCEELMMKNKNPSLKKLNINFKSEQATCFCTQLEPVSSELKCEEDNFETELQLGNEVQIHSEYKCEICFKSFGILSELQKHMKTHAQKFSGVSKKDFHPYSGSTACLVETSCSLKSPVKCTVSKGNCAVNDKHRNCIDSYSIKTPYECNICGLQFAQQKNLKLHLKTHGLGKYGCVICGKKFSSEHFYETHVCAQKVEKRRFQCELCARRFVQKAHLITHKLIHTGQKPHQCQVCDQKFAIKYNLQAHMLTHTDEKPYCCTHCDKAFKKKLSLKIHLGNHIGESAGTFICPDCGRNFMQNDTFLSHINAIKGEVGPYRCNICGGDFPRTTCLHWHVVKAHQQRSKEKSVRAYKCVVCLKTFKSHYNFQRHCRIHSSTDVDNAEHQTKFSCPDCARGFTQKISMLAHTKIKTKGKVFRCNDCGKEFIRRTCLQYHKITHIPLIGELDKAYRCTVCMKSFKYPSLYFEHMISHSENKNYTCKECGKSFKLQNALAVHSRIHAGIKGFSCSVCGRNFTQSSHVKTHMRVHTGEKPYVCCVCGRRFALKGNVKAHLKTHESSEAEGYKVSWKDTEIKQQPNIDISFNQQHVIHDSYECHDSSVHEEQVLDRLHEEPSIETELGKSSVINEKVPQMSDVQFMPHHIEDQRKEIFLVSISIDVPQVDKPQEELDWRLSSVVTITEGEQLENSLKVIHISHNPEKNGPVTSTTSQSQQQMKVVNVNPEVVVTMNIEDNKNDQDFVNKNFPHKSSFDQHVENLSIKEPLQNKSDCSEITIKKSFNNKVQISTLENVLIDTTEESSQSQIIFPVTYEENLALDNKATVELHLKCSVCSETFKSKQSLQEHILTHEPVNRFKENVCKSSEKYDCEFCGLTFQREKQLQNHLPIHKVKREHVCSVCNREFMLQASLKTHLLSHSNNKKVKCKICHKTLFTGSLKYHMLSHNKEHRFKCSICRKGFVRQSKLNIHYKIHTGEKPYQCSICFKKFVKKSVLEIHSLTHTEVKPYRCNICRKAFRQRVHLKMHVVTHMGKKNFVCEICDKSFTLLSNLKNHQKLHSKHFECRFCNKVLKSKESLMTHMDLHIGKGEGFQCNLCHKVARTKQGLKQHLRIHNDDESQISEKKNDVDVSKQTNAQNVHSEIKYEIGKSPKQFQCNICKKTFKYASSLSTHKYVHSSESKHTCDTCGKHFKLRSNLLTHQWTHSGTKLFQCKVCYRSFSQQSHVKTHMNVHTGIKPYLCSVCGKKFALNGNLKSHMKTHMDLKINQ